MTDRNTPPPSTLSLYRRAHGGSRDAVEALLARIRPRLQSWVAARLGPKLRGRVEAEDLVQEILAEAYVALDEFVPSNRKTFYGWFFRIARNTIADSAKHFGALKRDDEGTIPVHSGIVADQPTPSQIYVGDETEERLVLALAGLSHRHRDVIRLRRIEKLSTADTALEMGITPKNVSVLLGRALAALSEALSR